MDSDGGEDASYWLLILRNTLNTNTLHVVGGNNGGREEAVYWANIISHIPSPTACCYGGLQINKKLPSMVTGSSNVSHWIWRLRKLVRGNALEKPGGNVSTTIWRVFACHIKMLRIKTAGESNQLIQFICGTVFRCTSLLPSLSPSSTLILNHISSHFLSRFLTLSHFYSARRVTCHLGHNNR